MWEFLPPRKSDLEVERWDSRIIEHGEENQLEIALGGNVALGDPGDGLPEDGRSGESASVVSIEDGTQFLDGHLSSHETIVDCPLEVCRIKTR